MKDKHEAIKETVDTIKKAVLKYTITAMKEGKDFKEVAAELTAAMCSTFAATVGGFSIVLEDEGFVDKAIEELKKDCHRAYKEFHKEGKKVGGFADFFTNDLPSKNIN